MALKDIYKKIIHRSGKHAAIDFVRTPSDDWKRLVLGFVVVIIIVAGIDGYLFYKINAGDLFTAPPPAPTADAVNRTTLTTIADFYIAKQAAFNSIATSSVPADPSR